ncbi:MAG: hypothetical protein LBR37_02745, partial [Erysipelotrichaceae bacterium]|nr:hypothetical protein [Erysipelotrichaceae bacterium]
FVGVPNAESIIEVSIVDSEMNNVYSFMTRNPTYTLAAFYSSGSLSFDRLQYTNTEMVSITKYIYIDPITKIYLTVDDYQSVVIPPPSSPFNIGDLFYSSSGSQSLEVLGYKDYEFSSYPLNDYAVVVIRKNGEVVSETPIKMQSLRVTTLFDHYIMLQYSYNGTKADYDYVVNNETYYRLETYVLDFFTGELNAYDPGFVIRSVAATYYGNNGIFKYPLLRVAKIVSGVLLPEEYVAVNAKLESVVDMTKHILPFSDLIRLDDDHYLIKDINEISYLIDKSGAIITSLGRGATYDISYNAVAILHPNLNLYGAIDYTGKVLVPFESKIAPIFLNKATTTMMQDGVSDEYYLYTIGTGRGDTITVDRMVGSFYQHVDDAGKINLLSASGTTILVTEFLASEVTSTNIVSIPGYEFILFNHTVGTQNILTAYRVSLA